MSERKVNGGGLEIVSINVDGVVMGSANPRYEGRAYIRTNRPLECFFWSLAMKAGYSFGDKIEYEISIKKKN